MARASTKPELIASAATQFDKMQKLIASMSEEHQNTEFNFEEKASRSQAHWKRDKNLRDVLIHLYEWHQLLLAWVKANKNGEARPFLPAPYNWKTYGQMNVEFWEKHQSTSYEKARELLEQSHAEVMAMLETLTDDELFTKKYYDWTGTSTLGAYCISATASHYDWAMTKIKAHIKETK